MDRRRVRSRTFVEALPADAQAQGEEKHVDEQTQPETTERAGEVVAKVCVRLVEGGEGERTRVECGGQDAIRHLLELVQRKITFADRSAEGVHSHSRWSRC